MSTLKPKFKTNWKILNPIDTTNNIEIGEYGGVPLQIIEIGGKHILVTILKESKIEFLDPATLKKVDKTITLATRKETIYKCQLVNIKGEWHLIFIKRLDDKEFKNEIVCYNISTKQTKALDKVRYSVNDLIIQETDCGMYLFVVYRCRKDQVTKYDLNSLEKIGDFNLSVIPGQATLCKLENNGKPILMVDYWDESGQNHTTLLDPDSFSLSEDDDTKFYNQTYTGENGEVIMTVKRIDEKTFRGGQFYALPTEDSQYEIREMEIVDMGEGNKQLIMLINFYQYPANNQGPIKHQHHLLAFDAVSKKQLYDILLCDDPLNKKRFYSIIHQSRLIISVTEDRKSINKVYDLTSIDSEPLVIQDSEDNTDVGYNRDNRITHYHGKDYIILHKYSLDTHRRYYSLDNYRKSDDMVGIHDKYNSIYNILPYNDPITNRELFIIECADYRPSSYEHITILHNPSGEVDSSENVESYFQPIYVEIGKQSFIVTYTSDNNIKLIDKENGKELKTLKLETDGKIRQILVSEIKKKKALLVLSDKGIKVYDLPGLTMLNISYPNEYLDKMDILEMEGKKQLLTDANDENLYTSDLENGKLIHNPLNIASPNDKNQTLCAIHDYKVLKSKGKDFMLLTYSEGSESYLWYPEDNKLTPLIIDKAMWAMDEGNPDFVLTDALLTEIDGKEYIVALSHHGLITKFDTATGKRVGGVMKTGSEKDNNYIKMMDYNGEKILISGGDHRVKLWNLSDNKKLKDFSFDEEITGLETVGQKIIVCHQQNITAIGVE